jgi:hypothetical protein
MAGESETGVAVLTTRQVLEGAPVLIVEYDDGTWQFVCGTTNDTKDGRVVGFNEILAIDPSLKEPVERLRSGGSAWRKHVGGAWHYR